MVCVYITINNPPALELTIFQTENPEVGSLDEILERTTRNKDQLRELQQRVREVMGMMERDKVREKAIKSFINSTPDSTPPPAPSEHKRKKYDPIPPATQALIVQKMLYEGGSLTWDKACDTFGVSRASISRICGKEKRKQDGNDVVVPKKRGRKSPLSLSRYLPSSSRSWKKNHN